MQHRNGVQNIQHFSPELGGEARLRPRKPSSSSLAVRRRSQDGVRASLPSSTSMATASGSCSESHHILSMTQLPTSGGECNTNLRPLLTRLKLSTQRAGLLENHSSNIRLDIECKGANTMQECNCFGRQRLQTSVSFGIAGPLKNRSKYHLTETMLEYNRRIKPR